MSYFTFNRHRSDEFDLRIQNKTIYSVPKFDATAITVPGRDGDLLNPSGRFGNVGVSYTCYVPAKSIQDLSDKLTKIKNWLYGEVNQYHDLADSYDDKFKRRAVFNNKLDISDEARKIGVFTLSFSCLPFRYLLEGLEAIHATDTITIRNPFNFASKPYIKIYGSGEGTLVIQNEEGNKIWQFSDIDEYVEIDSELMNFFKGTELKNGTVSGDGFPLLAKGDNVLSFNGGITRIEIIPRWVSL